MIRAGKSPQSVTTDTARGIGKSTFVAGVVKALYPRGVKLAVFKCGIDYLDPSYHPRASGSPSHDLDAWMMDREAVISTSLQAPVRAGISSIEGATELFEEASASDPTGSTTEIAKSLDVPVSLLTRSFKAIGRGFADFDGELRMGDVSDVRRAAGPTSMCEELQAVGYVEVRTLQESISKATGNARRGFALE
jgi:cobyrinic acid a,c-diamide synthase